MITQATTNSAQGQPEELPQEGEKMYKGQTSDFFTAEQISALSKGQQIVAGAKEQYTWGLYVATPYLCGSYSVSKFSFTLPGYADAGRGSALSGYILHGLYYTTAQLADVSDALTADISDKVAEMIKTADDAEQNLKAQCDEWQIKRALEYRGADYEQDAMRIYTGIHKSDRSQYHRKHTDAETLLMYLHNPGDTVEKIAEKYVREKADAIAIGYFIEEGRKKALEALKASPMAASLDRLLYIRQAVKTTGAKTVQITLTNGAMVKAEADAVANMVYTQYGHRPPYISDFRIAAADRGSLPKNEYGRPCDVTIDMITAITYKGKCIYQASGEVAA